MSDHLQLGRLGEDAAARWYCSHGYQILDRNWSCSLGELDLIVRSVNHGRDLVVFVEVKTRRTKRYGTGFDAVTRDKQRRLRALAGQWLRSCGSRSLVDVRFDVVDVDGRGHVQVLEAAF